MTAALAFNPGRLGTTRRRKALVKAGRYALTLDFLVRSPGPAKGAGQRLMTSLTADWRRHNAIVIGYPATRVSSASTSSWVPAATIPEATATENAAWPSTPLRQQKRPPTCSVARPHLEGLRTNRRPRPSGQGS